MTLEALRTSLASCQDSRLLALLYTYFERSNRALARLAAHEDLPIQPPRLPLECEPLLKTAVSAVPASSTRC